MLFEYCIAKPKAIGKPVFFMAFTFPKLHISARGQKDVTTVTFLRFLTGNLFLV